MLIFFAFDNDVMESLKRRVTFLSLIFLLELYNVLNVNIAPGQVIKGRLGFWIPRHGFRISILIGIPDSTSKILQDFEVRILPFMG